MKPTLQSLFPNASQSCHAANPHLKGSMGNDLALGRGPTSKNNVQPIVERKKGKRGVMNGTEREYSLILKGMQARGEILRFEFEGITLRWADMRYTPDFIVFDHPIAINYTEEGPKRYPVTFRLIEVKGGHIWDRDIVRFKGARAYWPEFAFEMHQKTKDGWKRKF